MTAVTGFFNVDGARIYYEERGKGPCIIFNHGFAVDHRMWDPQFETFSQRFRVVRYDLRGFGKSDMPSEPYSTLDDLRSIMDQLDIETACLIGSSLSGSLAIEFALSWPERVTGLVLAGSNLRGYSHSDAYVKEYLRYREVARREGIEAAQAVMLENLLLRSIAKKSELFASIEAMIRDYSGFHLVSRDPHRVFYPRAIDRLGEITCPVQIIVGQHDIADLQGVARQLIREIKHARSTVIPDVGHIVNMEAPEPFNRIVLDFLKALPTKRSAGCPPVACSNAVAR
jgi:3-oxoadipate enol-lactonase